MDTAEKQGLIVAGIFDSDYHQTNNSVYGVPVIGSETNLESIELKDYCFFVGSNWSPHNIHARDKAKRTKFINLVKEYQLDLINLIDPTAIVSKYAKLGSGVFIGANVVVEPTCLVDHYAQIFYNVSVSYGSTIGENSSIQNNSVLVARIGKNSFIGMTSIIFPYFSTGHIEIGDNVFVYPNMRVHENLENNFVFS